LTADWAEELGKRAINNTFPKRPGFILISALSKLILNIGDISKPNASILGFSLPHVAP
jgi:hypothetical protein